MKTQQAMIINQRTRITSWQFTRKRILRDIAKYGHDSNLKSSLYEVGAGFEINT